MGVEDVDGEGFLLVVFYLAWLGSSLCALVVWCSGLATVLVGFQLCGFGWHIVVGVEMSLCSNHAWLRKELLGGGETRRK